MGVFGRYTQSYISDVEEAEVVSYLTCRMHVVKLSFLKWKFLQSQVVSTWAAIDLSLGAQSVDVSKVVAIPDIVFKEMIN